jgi:hypothetical protein
MVIGSGHLFSREKDNKIIKKFFRVYLEIGGKFYTDFTACNFECGFGGLLV